MYYADWTSWNTSDHRIVQRTRQESSISCCCYYDFIPFDPCIYHWILFDNLHLSPGVCIVPYLLHVQPLTVLLSAPGIRTRQSQRWPVWWNCKWPGSSPALYIFSPLDLFLCFLTLQAANRSSSFRSSSPHEQSLSTLLSTPSVEVTKLVKDIPWCPIAVA